MNAETTSPIISINIAQYLTIVWEICHFNPYAERCVTFCFPNQGVGSFPTPFLLLLLHSEHFVKILKNSI